MKWMAVGFFAVQPAVGEEPNDRVIKVEQAEKRVAEGAQLLDVRTADEWAEGRIPGAQRIDISEAGFVEKAKAQLDPDKPVVVYCRTGRRSEKAAELLRAAGFGEIQEIGGGIVAWEKAGKPIEK